MFQPLFNKELDLFPITPETTIYIKGLKIRSITGYFTFPNTNTEKRDVINEKNLYKNVQNNEPGFKLLLTHLDSAPTKSEVHLALDLIKDLVTNNELEKIFLTDFNKQAQFISKTFRCICTTDQVKDCKNPVKIRLKNIKRMIKDG